MKNTKTGRKYVDYELDAKTAQNWATALSPFFNTDKHELTLDHEVTTSIIFLDVAEADVHGTMLIHADAEGEGSGQLIASPALVAVLESLPRKMAK